MAEPVAKGQKVSEHYDILGNCVHTGLTNDAGIIAGEVYPYGPFIVISGITVAKDASSDATYPGWVMGHFVVRKKAGTAWVKGDPIIFEAVAAHEYLAGDVATFGQSIHAYAFAAAASGAVEGRILGPFLPPFGVVGGAADIADFVALAEAAAEGQIVVTDGTGGFAITSFVIPVVDGGANEILKRTGANTVTWQADAV